MDTEPEDAHETLCTYVRKFEREPVELPVQVKLVKDDGEIFDRGTAMLRDVSPDGALLTELKLDHDSMPAVPFKLVFTIIQDERAEVRAEGRPVRIIHEPTFGLGVALDTVKIDVDTDADS